MNNILLMFFFVYLTTTLNGSLIPKPEPSNVTVLIHGTRTTQGLPKLIRPLLYKIENPFFNNQEHGLQKINPQQKKYNYFHQEFGPLLTENDNKKFPLEHMYVFGHEGTLNPKKRELDGYKLFHLLERIHNEYIKRDGTAPSFTVVGHSHGGNIGLNIAKGLHDNPLTFTIDKLVLLATPVQKFTKHLVASPLFEKVYSFHSHLDVVQIIDLQGLYKHKQEKNEPYKLLSKRHFKSQKKLTQTRVKWKKGPIFTKLKHTTNAETLFKLWSTLANITGKKRDLTHVEFMLPAFVSQLPCLIDEADQKVQVDNKKSEILSKL